MITEQQIETVIQGLEDGKLEDSFAIDQEEYLEYLVAEVLPGLNSAEKDLFAFIISVVNLSVEAEEKELDLDDYLDKEEENWKTRTDASSWDDCKDQYFQDYNEEDLLAFVEDMLATDEEKDLTEIGKELVFITSKSFIDALTDEG